MLSRTDPLARRLRALRGDAKLRDAEKVFVAEGIHLAIDALAAGALIDAAIVSPRLAESENGRNLERRLRESVVAVHVASDALLDALQDVRSPQPVVLIVRRTSPALSAVIAGREGTPLVVVACGVQEPGNLGALWRTADAAGASGFVATHGSAHLTHPRTVRASMGAIFRIPAVEASIDAVLQEVNSRQFRVVGANARAATAYDDADWTGPLALLLGGEGSGIPPEAEEALDLRVAIPMGPGVESLSVNAAAAVLLFEAARRRRPVSRA
jgi:TrmH family RNA methyltransferase